MTSVSITREKERGTMEVLLVSPMKPIYVILSKTVPYFLLSAINLLTILLIAVFVMEVPIVGSLSLLIILSLLYIFVCLSFGILISSIVQTQLAAMVISAIGLMMPVMILSGMMFPIDNMPWILQRVSDIIPAKWYILATKKIMIKGLSWDAVLVELSVLTGMAVVLIAISLKKFKKRLE
jgi:ABC-2 type transport system permease protein